MKHSVIALKVHPGDVSVDGDKIRIKLPDGCLGICFAFESKKKAREYLGKDIDFVRIEKIEIKA